MAKRNAIIESFKKLEAEEPEEQLESPSEFSEEDEPEYEVDDSNELTDEDVIEEVERMDSESRASVERSRTRGKASTAGRRPGRETTAKAEARARAPEREREVEWQPANTLDAPPPRPGMEQRWIRYTLGNENDPRNWSRKTRERWAPRKMDTVSDDFAPPTMAHGKLGEVIGVADLILCERPVSVGIARRKHFRQRHQHQMAAVTRKHTDKAQRDGHEIEVSVKRGQPTVGRGRRKAEAQED